MNILAIETATTGCAIGLRTAEGEFAATLDLSRRHTEVLTDGIAALLAAHGCTPRDLSRIVVDRGPGLFTGLRVGLATAMALGQALGVDVVGVTSLEVTAQQAYDEGYRGELVALIDGRRGECFGQRFTVNDDGARPLDDARVAPAREWWGALTTPCLVAGDGAVRYRDDLGAIAGVTLSAWDVPDPLSAIRLGATRPVVALTPLYLREADAVANFSTRERS